MCIRDSPCIVGGLVELVKQRAVLAALPMAVGRAHAELLGLAAPVHGLPLEGLSSGNGERQLRLSL
eukprot:11705157-Alexandrium_andersonii.AAC.1